MLLLVPFKSLEESVALVVKREFIKRHSYSTFMAQRFAYLIELTLKKCLKCVFDLGCILFVPTEIWVCFGMLCGTLK